MFAIRKKPSGKKTGLLLCGRPPPGASAGFCACAAETNTCVPRSTQQPQCELRGPHTTSIAAPQGVRALARVWLCGVTTPVDLCQPMSVPGCGCGSMHSSPSYVPFGASTTAPWDPYVNAEPRRWRLATCSGWCCKSRVSHCFATTACDSEGAGALGLVGGRSALSGGGRGGGRGCMHAGRQC